MTKNDHRNWYSIVNIQECYYAGGIIDASGKAKPVVTILDMYYTGSPKLSDEGRIFSDISDSLVEALCNEVWKGAV